MPELYLKQGTESAGEHTLEKQTEEKDPTLKSEKDNQKRRKRIWRDGIKEAPKRGLETWTPRRKEMKRGKISTHCTQTVRRGDLCKNMLSGVPARDR